MADHIAPTYAAGTISIISLGQVSNVLGDYYNRNTTITGSTVQGGYVNVIESSDVGSFNADKNDFILSKVPVNLFTQQS